MLYTTKYRGGTIVRYKDHLENYVVVGRASWEPEDQNMYIMQPKDVSSLVAKTYGYAPRPEELKDFEKAIVVEPDEIVFRNDNGLHLGAIALSMINSEKLIVIGVNNMRMDGSFYDLAYPNSGGKTTVLHWTQLNPMDRD